jgi:hypothetical protein
MSGILGHIGLLLPGSASGLTYATWNPADMAGTISLSNGNKTAQRTGGSTLYNSVRATLPVSAPSYWEVRVPWAGLGARCAIGVCQSSLALLSGTVFPGSTADSVGCFGPNNTVYLNNSGTDYPDGDSTSLYGLAFDPVTGKIWIRDFAASTGTGYFGGGNPAAGTSPTKTLPAGTYYPCVCAAASDVMTANFGASAFTGAVPAGFNAGVY